MRTAKSDAAASTGALTATARPATGLDGAASPLERAPDATTASAMSAQNVRRTRFVTGARPRSWLQSRT